MRLEYRSLASAAITVCMFAISVAAQTPDSGWYTSNPDADTFYISNADELAGLADIVNREEKLGTKAFEGKTIILIADIDLSEYGKNSVFNDGKGWEPIGREVHILAFAPCPPEMDCPPLQGASTGVPFSGVFDGAGHKITNLYINRTAADASPHISRSGAGLFGHIIGGTIKNLGIEGAEIVSAGVDDYVGIIAGLVESFEFGNTYVPPGSASGWVIGCYATGTVSGSKVNSNKTGNYVGGVVGGFYDGLVVNSYFDGAVTGNYIVGGIAGRAEANGSTTNILGCYSAGTVTSNGIAGGVVGITKPTGKVEYSYSISAVTSAGIAGGIIGSDKGGLGGFTGSAKSCAALNPSVTTSGSEFGRIFGNYYESPVLPRLDSLFAFVGMELPGQIDTVGIRTSNGADMTIDDIHADGTINGIFTSANGWTTAPDKLPGLFSQTVDMPPHLQKKTSISLPPSVQNNHAPIITVRGRTLNIKSSSPNAISQVRLIDIRGSTVRSFTSSGDMNFSLLGISAGYYFVEVREMGNRRFTRAFIF